MKISNMNVTDSCEYKGLFMQEFRLTLLHYPLYFRAEGTSIDSSWLEKLSVAQFLFYSDFKYLVFHVVSSYFRLVT